MYLCDMLTCLYVKRRPYQILLSYQRCLLTWASMLHRQMVSNMLTCFAAPAVRLKDVRGRRQAKAQLDAPSRCAERAAISVEEDRGVINLATPLSLCDRLHVLLPLKCLG